MSLLVDTLYELEHSPAGCSKGCGGGQLPADNIETVVNTHANGDHWAGAISMVAGAQIVASRRAAKKRCEKR